MKRNTSAARRHEAFLAGLIVLMTMCAVGGGYLIGRHVSRDAFIERVGSYRLDEGSSLLAAGTAPLTLYDVIKGSLDDSVTVDALSNIYKAPVSNRDMLIERLRQVMWLPGYEPAPFVGHIARPYSDRNLHINALGFRDKRDHFETKADDTIRIFVTGGSTAWGSGASSDDSTVSALLEQKLQKQILPHTGYKYEVVNAAFPGWSTTQEKILIQQRLVDLHPDIVLMFSGNNDVHWALNGRDTRWFYSYMDQNYITLLNEMYKAAGHSEWNIKLPIGSRPMECKEVAAITARNVGEAALAAQMAGAQLLFVLQPNIVSTAKRLTERERHILASRDKSYWSSCYQALRLALADINVPNYRFIDLSHSFGTLGDDVQLFIDPYHFSDLGNQIIADHLLEQINWKAVHPTRI